MYVTSNNLGYNPYGKSQEYSSKSTKNKIQFMKVRILRLSNNSYIIALNLFMCVYINKYD